MHSSLLIRISLPFSPSLLIYPSLLIHPSLLRDFPRCGIYSCLFFFKGYILGNVCIAYALNIFFFRYIHFFTQDHSRVDWCHHIGWRLPDVPCCYSRASYVGCTVMAELLKQKLHECSEGQAIEFNNKRDEESIESLWFNFLMAFCEHCCSSSVLLLSATNVRTLCMSLHRKPLLCQYNCGLRDWRFLQIHAEWMALG